MEPTRPLMERILNRKHALSSLTDADFEALLPELATELAANGVLRESYPGAEIQKDWALLLKKDATINATTISATEVDVLWGDASKAARVLGWRPRTSFQQLIADMVQQDTQTVYKII